MSYYGANNNNPSYPQPGQGEAASYFNSGNAEQQYAAPQQQQRPDGPDGERGVMGAIGGGLAGGVGGHALGGKAGHGKLGTVLGVVGGALAGHKLQDGISDWKHKRDEEKQEHQQQEQQQQQQHHDEKKPEHQPPPRHGLNYAGNFSGSSRDIRLDPSNGEYMLHASCKRMDGSYQASSISLNKLLENDQGSFRWAANDRKSSSSNSTRQVTVQPGDTLRAIAAQFGTTFEEIARTNGIQNPDLIYPGQVLNIPGAGACNSGGADVGNFGMSARNVRLADGGSRLEAELLRNGNWVGSSIVLDERIGNDNGTLTFKS